jgi:hypothetical protein
MTRPLLGHMWWEYLGKGDEAVLRLIKQALGGANVLSRLVSENRHSVLSPRAMSAPAQRAEPKPFLQRFFHVLCGGSRPDREA